MYSSPKGEQFVHTQVGKRSSSLTYQAYYWRCVFLLFESSARLNSGARHILFVNQFPPDSVDGIDIEMLIKQYRVEVVVFDTLTLSPTDYYGAWNTQFLVLDVLDWVAKHCQPDDAVFILDSDIVFIKPIDKKLLSDLREKKALLYSLDLGENYVNNGLTPAELLEVSRELDPYFSPSSFVYSGGEFICILGSEARRIASMAREVYLRCIERHQRRQKKFNEEAHLLSFVYQSLGYENYSANHVVKRIWTDRSVESNVTGDEGSLIMWHLPAEKKNGFVKLFRSFVRVGDKYTLPSTELAITFRLKESRAEALKRKLFRTPARRIISILRAIK
jgi:hypothetical protein